MATCGYLCPQCEGRGFREDGSPCDWCSVATSAHKENVPKNSIELSDEDWIEKVHGKCSCSDIGPQEE